MQFDKRKNCRSQIMLPQAVLCIGSRAALVTRQAGGGEEVIRGQAAESDN